MVPLLLGRALRHLPLMRTLQHTLSPTTNAIAAAAVVVASARMSSNSVAVSDGSIAEQKKALRTRLRKELRAFPSSQRAQEDAAIQDNVLNSPWFKSSKTICAYISCESLREVDTSRILAEVLSDHEVVKKKLYVPRVEDRNSNMRMLNISTLKDLVANSMNILEPTLMDADGNPREDVLQASDPVDLFLLPGLAFDRNGRRLGRGGGYYDVLLRRYQNVAMEQNWKQPLFVALAYSPQIMEDEVIPVTATDVPIDAIVSPSGVIAITPAAKETMEGTS